MLMEGSCAALSREPVSGATVFRLAPTVPDGSRPLMQVGGSPFDHARRRSTDQSRMACKRSGVRISLAPLSCCFRRSEASVASADGVRHNSMSRYFWLRFVILAGQRDAVTACMSRGRSWHHAP
jgi:hypothetical protein